MIDTETSEQFESRFSKAQEQQAPAIYTNGFAFGLSGGDGSLVLERNGEPVAVINLSFTLAKTLALALGTAVSNFEQVTGQQLLTTHDVDRRFKESAEKERENGPVLQ